MTTGRAVYLSLGGLTVELDSSAAAVQAYWRYLFGDWLRETAVAPPVARLTVYLVKTLPPLPAGAPFFTDARNDWERGAFSVLEAYRPDDGRLVLHFFEGGLVTLPPAHAAADLPTAVGFVTSETFANGRMEDITLVGLAPLLRVHGRYLLHAAGVSHRGRALLLVGASGSGKTTTSLNLLLHGWQLLANDVVLLTAESDGVTAWPLPDKITVRPKTLALLPQLAQFAVGAQQIAGVALPADFLPSHQLVGGNWSPPARVEAICFPQVTDRATADLDVQPRAVTLARLLEESVDCWDPASLDAHTALLTALSQQAIGYRLRLGADLAALPALLAALC